MQQRVFNGEAVPAEEKIVSPFEPHTDIIVKDKRETQYSHKVNLATQIDGFVTYMNVEDGNPSDKVLYLPVLEKHGEEFQQLPETTVADGGYATQSNCKIARKLKAWLRQADVRLWPKFTSTDEKCTYRRGLRIHLLPS